jgi:S1-C subfamily serine protease
MRMILKRKIIEILILSFFIVGCCSTYSTPLSLKKIYKSKVNADSFSKVVIFLEISFCEKNNFKNCFTQSLTVSGSSFSIKKIKSKNLTGTFLITAAHVCNENYKFIEEITEDLESVELVTNSIITGYNNTSEPFSIKILNYDMKSDLCLLWAQDVLIKPVSISNKIPVLGEPIYSIAAPFGLYEPNNYSLIFQGIYSGKNSDGSSMMSIHSRQGSSGAPVFDMNGNLISVIHSTSVKTEHITMGASLKEIKAYIKKNKVLGL